MKKIYNTPVAEIQKFILADIVTQSPEPTTGSGSGDGGWEEEVTGEF